MIPILFTLMVVHPPDFLQERLEADSVYSETIGEGLLLFVEYEDSTTSTGEPGHYFRIAIRENHEIGGEGDPNTCPVRDRFKVYTDGRIFWWSPLPGMYIPYCDFIEGVTEL